MMNLPSCPIQNLQVSARLRISEFTWQDAADLAHMHQNPRVRELLMDDLPLDTTNAAQRFIDGMQRFYRQYEGTGIWRAERAIAPDAESVAQARQAYAEGEIHETLLALVEAPTWQFCGWFSLVHLMDAPDALEIGARLSPDAWGAALALDGGEWLLNQAFQTLKREQVFGHCSPRNRSAAHCLRVLGFERVGLAPYNGQQAERFSLSRARWQQWGTLPRRKRQRQALAAAKAGR